MIIPPFPRERIARFWSKVSKAPGLGPTGECWEWQGGKISSGYGCLGFRIDGKVVTFLAHRISWFLEYGEQPKKCCCHRCDNPACVRPEHLFCGAQNDNVQDRENKGRGGGDKIRGKNNGQHTMPWRTCRGQRWRRLHLKPEVAKRRYAGIRKYHRDHPEAHQGVNNPRAKLNEEDVKTIRRLYSKGDTSSLKLASAFDVSKQVILSIIHRRSWAHVK